MISNTKKYKHIIWDWNGTVLDDAWLCLKTLNEILSKRGMQTITLQEYQRCFGFPVIDYYRKVGFNFETESFDIIAAEYINAYESRLSKCKLQKGAVETMEKIKQAHIGQSVLSASQQESLEAGLNMFGLRKYFVKTAGLNDYYAHSKIDIGKALLKNLSLSGNEVLLIGDTIHDFEVACQIGSDCILVPGGHQSKERLIACGAKVCDTINDITYSN